MTSSDYEPSENFTLDLIDEVPCPRCDKTLRVPKDHSGKIMCPNCEWKFQYPLPQGANPLLTWLDGDPNHIVNKAGLISHRIYFKTLYFFIITSILFNIFFW